MRTLRVSNLKKAYDFDFDDLSYYGFEILENGKLAFVVKEIDGQGRNIFINNESLSIKVVEEKETNRVKPIDLGTFTVKDDFK